jgi:DNA-binding response OmpR family regulator
MITSRIAEKHREHAMELGVNHYLGKPYSDEELLSLIQHYPTGAGGCSSLRRISGCRLQIPWMRRLLLHAPGCRPVWPAWRRKVPPTCS